MMCLRCPVLLIFLFYAFAQFWASLCYEGYKELTVVTLHNGTWKGPNTTTILRNCEFKEKLSSQLVYASKQKALRTCLNVSKQEQDACAPSREKIEETAMNYEDLSRFWLVPVLDDNWNKDFGWLYCFPHLCLSDYYLDSWEGFMTCYALVAFFLLHVWPKCTLRRRAKRRL